MACGSGLTRGMVSFTHRALEALWPSYTPYRVSDQRCVGLAVRVAPSGVKTWDLLMADIAVGESAPGLAGACGRCEPRKARERANS
jgi:hypothetical protein